MKYAIILLFVLGISIVGINEVFATQDYSTYLTSASYSDIGGIFSYTVTNEDTLETTTHVVDNSKNRLGSGEYYEGFGKIIKPGTTYTLSLDSNSNFTFASGSCIIGDKTVINKDPIITFTAKYTEMYLCEWRYQKLSTLTINNNAVFPGTTTFKYKITSTEPTISTSITTSNSSSVIIVNSLKPGIEYTVTPQLPYQFSLTSMVCTPSFSQPTNNIFKLKVNENVTCEASILYNESPDGSGPTTIYEIPINRSDDDARELGSDDTVGLYDFTLFLGRDTVGLKFNNIPIDKTQKIVNAYIRLAQMQPGGPSGILGILIQDEVNPSAFSTKFRDITDRPVIREYTQWDLSSWTGDRIGQTPDISGPLNKMIGKNNWNSGDSFAAIFSRSVGNDGIEAKWIYSYDAFLAGQHEGNLANDPYYIPTLVIEATDQLPAPRIEITVTSPPAIVNHYEYKISSSTAHFFMNVPVGNGYGETGGDILSGEHTITGFDIPSDLELISESCSIRGVSGSTTFTIVDGDIVICDFVYEYIQYPPTLKIVVNTPRETNYTFNYLAKASTGQDISFNRLSSSFGFASSIKDLVNGTEYTVIQTNASSDLKLKSFQCFKDINIKVKHTFTAFSNDEISCVFKYKHVDVSNSAYETFSNQDVRVSDEDFSFDDNILGFRFIDIQLDPNQAIKSAYIQFTSKDFNNSTISLKVYADRDTNSPVFKEADGNISNRIETQNSLTWDVPYWDMDEKSTNTQTPDLTKMISEIINTQGWNKGNAISVIFKDMTPSSSVREVHSFATVDPDQRPELIIETVPILKINTDATGLPGIYKYSVTSPNATDISISMDTSPTGDGVSPEIRLDAGRPYTVTSTGVPAGVILDNSRCIRPGIAILPEPFILNNGEEALCIFDFGGSLTNLESPTIEVIINTDTGDDTSFNFSLLEFDEVGKPRQDFNIDIKNNTGTTGKIQLNENPNKNPRSVYSFQLQERKVNQDYDFDKFVCSVNGEDRWVPNGRHPYERIDFNAYLGQEIICTYDYVNNSPPPITPNPPITPSPTPPTLEIISTTDIGEGEFRFDVIIQSNTKSFPVNTVNNTGTTGKITLIHDGYYTLIASDNTPTDPTATFDVKSYDCKNNGNSFVFTKFTTTLGQPALTFIPQNDNNIVCTFEFENNSPPITPPSQPTLTINGSINGGPSNVEHLFVYDVVDTGKFQNSIYLKVDSINHVATISTPLKVGHEYYLVSADINAGYFLESLECKLKGITLAKTFLVGINDHVICEVVYQYSQPISLTINTETYTSGLFKYKITPSSAPAFEVEINATKDWGGRSTMIPLVNGTYYTVEQVVSPPGLVLTHSECVIGTGAKIPQPFQALDGNSIECLFDNEPAPTILPISPTLEIDVRTSPNSPDYTFEIDVKNILSTKTDTFYIKTNNDQGNSNSTLIHNTMYRISVNDLDGIPFTLDLSHCTNSNTPLSYDEVIFVATNGDDILCSFYLTHDSYLSPTNPVNPAPTEQKKKSGGGGCADCEPPTLGLNKQGKRQVDNGITVNGNSTNVEYFHTPTDKIIMNIGEEQEIKFKVYENGGFHNMHSAQLGIGVKEIGTPLSISEAIITTTMNQHDIESIEIEDKNNLFVVNATTVTTKEVLCMKTQTKPNCTEFTIKFTFAERPDYDVFRIDVTDVAHNNSVNFFNDGIEVQGETLNEQPTYKVYNRYSSTIKDGMFINLTRTDKVTDMWVDEKNRVWHYLGNDRFEKLTPDPPYVCSDISLDEINSGWTRNNCNFDEYIDLQAKKALETMAEICPDCLLPTFNDMKESFGHDITPRFDNKLNDPEMILRLEAEAQRALEYLQNNRQ